MEKNKSELRKEKLNLRRLLSEEDIISNSIDIADKLFSMDEYKNSENLLLYSSIQNEVDTQYIALKAIEDNKNIYFPRVNNDTMDFYRIFSFSDLVPGYMKIPEPNPDIFDVYRQTNNTIIIVPLSVFDRTGNRIGYGGGFYDKYLSKINVLKIGIAYSIQECKSIDYEPTDVKMDYIITEKEIIEVLNDRF